ncbi:unnamed protein product [Phytophthora lilii]|uniref:Unnamed protein product n=1 Tax=Phytophthora lilii TaxID=2077276 RepID=A0A9W6TUR8_9STRA|nr:unnamed protein product [Phytophthora lilii]
MSWSTDLKAHDSKCSCQAVLVDLLPAMMEDGGLRDPQPTGEFEEASTPKLQERMDKATQDQVRYYTTVALPSRVIHGAVLLRNGN